MGMRKSFGTTFATRGSQRGAVLVVGLVMLTVMTLLVVSMIKTSVVELKIGGASQISQHNLANAELLINNFLNENNTRFAAHYLGLAAASGGPVPPPGDGTGSYNATTTIYTVTPTTLLHGAANIQIRQIQCTPRRVVGQDATAFQYVFFDVRSTATGTLGGSTTVHQGIRTTVPSGSC